MKSYTFTFGNRYGQRRTATLLSDDSGEGTFHIYGESHYVRGGEGMFDFEGGPFYGEGGDFHGRGDILSVVPAPKDTPEGGCYVLVKLNKNAKREIKNWNENRQKVEALKEEVNEWLDNGL